MNSSLYKKYQLKYLANRLNVGHVHLESIINSATPLYYTKEEKKIDSRTGEYKRYEDGTIKTRRIDAPITKLKSIQKSINNEFFSNIIFPENIQGGVKGRSNITNALAHKGNKYLLCTDLQDFYPSITNKMVYNVFLAMDGVSNQMASILTKLTTVNYKVPQGAPTSSYIANLVMSEVDKELMKICEENGITYTRFIDDLTFSGPNDFRHLIGPMFHIITSAGFKISHRKTSYNGTQEITGIIVSNNSIEAPHSIKNKAAKELEEGSLQKPYTNYINRIKSFNKS